MDYETKKAIGLEYVTDLISPLSGPGKRLLREISFFDPSRYFDLETEFAYIDFFIDALKNHPKEIDNAKKTLSRFKDIPATIRALGTRDLDETEIFEIKNFCMLCEELRYTYVSFLPYFITVFGRKQAPNEIILSYLGEVQDIFGKSEGFCIEDEASPELAEIRIKKRQLLSEMKKSKGEEKTRIEKELSELAKKEYDIGREILSELSRKLAPFADILMRNLEVAGHIDLLIQKAEMAKKYHLCRPVPSISLEIIRGINPMIAAAVEENGGSFCPITLIAQSGVTVITGANMGGKTVALKTIALNAALAQSGFYVFAHSFSYPMFKSIELISLDGQDYKRGLSSFAADVMRLNDLYHSVGEKGRLILCDEFASATNACEGSAIFKAFVDAFMKTNDFVIMTTHFDGVCDSADARYQVSGLMQLPEEHDKKKSPEARIKEVSKYMDYGLYPISKDAPIPRDAIKICKLLGIDKTILDSIDEENS